MINKNVIFLNFRQRYFFFFYIYKFLSKNLAKKCDFVCYLTLFKCKNAEVAFVFCYVYAFKMLL